MNRKKRRIEEEEQEKKEDDGEEDKGKEERAKKMRRLLMLFCDDRSVRLLSSRGGCYPMVDKDGCRDGWMDDQVVLDTFGFISLLAFYLFAWRRCWCSFGPEMEAFYDGNFTGRMSDAFLSFAISYLHAQIGFAWRRTDTTCILNVFELGTGREGVVSDSLWDFVCMFF